MKIKVVSITNEMISYHFTSDLYNLYFNSSLWMTLVFFIVSKPCCLHFRFFYTPNLIVSELNYQVGIHFLSYKVQNILDPVVQSVVSLTSSLRVISLIILADSIYNILIFFAEKM